MTSCIRWSQFTRGLSAGKKHKKDKKAHKHEKDTEKEKKSKKDKKSKKGDADDIETEPLRSKSKSKSKPVSTLEWLHTTNLGQFLATERVCVVPIGQKPDVNYSVMYSAAPRVAIGGAAVSKDRK